MQDLDGADDPYCVECWECSLREGGFPALYYLGKDDCYEENVVSEEEFARIEHDRHLREEYENAVKPVSGRSAWPKE